MTAKDVILKSKEEGSFFGKYVKTESGYHFSPHFVNHGSLVPNGEVPITAGFISVSDGNICKIMREGSMTLQRWPDSAIDLPGIREALGIATKMVE